MKITKKKGYLLTSSFILLAVGAYISLSTTEYLKHFGVVAPGNTNFYSDLRSMGGNLLGFGIFAFVGAFKKTFEQSAVLMSTIVFSAYGLFRFSSMAVDGIPGPVILTATTIEVVFALIGFSLIYAQKKNQL